MQEKFRLFFEKQKLFIFITIFIIYMIVATYAIEYYLMIWIDNNLINQYEFLEKKCYYSNTKLVANKCDSDIDKFKTDNDTKWRLKYLRSSKTFAFFFFCSSLVIIELIRYEIRTRMKSNTKE